MDLVRRLVHGPERKRTRIERKRFLRLLWSYGIGSSSFLLFLSSMTGRWGVDLERKGAQTV
jgi:hypothetical protein